MNLKVVDYGKVINTFANRTKTKYKFFFFFSKMIFPKSSKMVIKVNQHENQSSFCDLPQIAPSDSRDQQQPTTARKTKDLKFQTP